MVDIIKIYDKNPNQRDLMRVAKVLEGDGLIIYPTDGVYALGCSIRSAKAIERLKQIRHRRDEELTLLCDSFSALSGYTRIDNVQFKILKRNLPGRFTFILNASSRVPDKALGRRKCVGIRIPDNVIARAIAAELGGALITASVKEQNDDVSEYTTDPELIAERYGDLVDLIVDGGCGDSVPTTLVDLTTDEPEIVREGGGELS